jgi:hypothetical protein
MMETAIHVAEQAFVAGDYSRAGIINAARIIDFVSPLQAPGGVGQMNADDAFYAAATGLVQWSDAAVRFERIGDIIDYNGSLGTYTP